MLCATLCLLTALTMTVDASAGPVSIDNKQPQQYLFRGIELGKYVYFDVTGQVVLRPDCTDAGVFSEGLAAIKQGELYGYINVKGEMVIEPQFEYGHEFSEGLAFVRLADKQACIDKTGAIVFETDYSTVNPFHEGLAVAHTTRIKEEGGVDFFSGFIDTTGNIVVDPNTSHVSEISEGLALVFIDGKYGFIDTTGKLVIEAQYDFASSFYDGLAAVAIESENKKETGYIDKEGQWALKLAADNVFDLSDGLALYSTDFRGGYIDKTGRIVIEPQFAMAMSFSEGLAAVKLFEPGEIVDGKMIAPQKSPHDKLWGYIDKTGKVVIDPRFNVAMPFQHGLARVQFYLEDRERVRHGYVNPKGDIVWIDTKELKWLEKERQSRAMLEILLAMSSYAHDNQGQWPDSLDQLRPYFNIVRERRQQETQGRTSFLLWLGDAQTDEQLFEIVMTNPVTGDNPGYIYVKPKRSYDEVRENHELIPLLYEARDGKTNPDGPIGYSDGRVRESK